MLPRYWRHHILQAIFWNPVGAAVVRRLVSLELMFDTVVRNYSLITATNGERWLTELISEAPVVVDVGFHDGQSTTEILARRPNATVYGFDPSGFGRESYKARFAGDDRVVFFNVALSDAPGTLMFYDYDNMCNSLVVRREMGDEKPRSYEVAVTTFDAVARRGRLPQVDLMKIDAEGYDLNVLEGAREALQDQRIDIFMFEFATGWANNKRYLWEAVEYFEPLPYRLFRLFNGFVCPLVYDMRIDSCATLPAMYVGVSELRLGRGDIPVRDYRF